MKTRDHKQFEKYQVIIRNKILKLLLGFGYNERMSETLSAMTANYICFDLEDAELIHQERK